MAVNNITQTISTLPMAGHRGVDVQTIFVNKQEAFQDALTEVFVGQINTLRSQLNTFVSELNLTATQVNTNATTATTQAGIATTKANEASTSASQALISRNQAETFKNQALTYAQQAEVSAGSVNASNIVHKTGDETIDDIKTFIKSPVVPAPINSGDAVNKAYVDNISAVVKDSSSYAIAMAIIFENN